MTVDANHQQFSFRAAAVLAAGLLIAGNAIAANNAPCDKSRAELVTAGGMHLNIDAVDHVPPLTSLELGDSLELADTTTEAAQPVIELTPQVESLFERIFDDEAESADSVETPAPVAESSIGDGADSAMQDSDLEISPEVSRFHAEMFRKDI